MTVRQPDGSKQTMTHHETPDKRRINDDPVALPPALVPARSVLTGSTGSTGAD